MSELTLDQKTQNIESKLDPGERAIKPLKKTLSDLFIGSRSGSTSINIGKKKITIKMEFSMGIDTAHKILFKK